MTEKPKSILFAGGGTIGSVAPMLAVFDELKKRHPHAAFHWVGTKNGPEKRLVADKHIAYSFIPAAKLDRFFSLRNFMSPILFLLACVKSVKIMRKVKPDLIISAGGFVAVPLVLMGWVLRIPSMIHQLDLRPGLANKMMAPFVKAVTVTFEKSLKDFSKKKTLWTGAPVRTSILLPKTDKFVIKEDRPLVLIFGGGTGALAINQLVWGALEELTLEAQIIHITGKGKGSDISHKNYFQHEFLADEMGEVYHKADVVVTRAGLGTFLELAALKKPAIIIPMPDTHQEDNSSVLAEANAALVLDQTSLSPQIFAGEIIRLTKDEERKREFSQNIGRFYRPDSVDKIVEKIEEILYSSDSSK